MSDKKKEVQEYLANNVNTWVEPMIYDIVKKRPTDPVAHAHKWLSNYISKSFLKYRRKEAIIS